MAVLPRRSSVKPWKKVEPKPKNEESVKNPYHSKEKSREPCMCAASTGYHASKGVMVKRGSWTHYNLLQEHLQCSLR